MWREYEKIKGWIFTKIWGKINKFNGQAMLESSMKEIFKVSNFLVDQFQNTNVLS